MTDLPKFQFNNASVKTEEDLKALTTSNTDKYFRPGLHTVTITKAEYKGKATDPNWGKVYLTYTGTGDKWILDTILIPERDVVYVGKNGKKTGFIYQKFQKFVNAALGVELALSNLSDTMTSSFSNVEKSLVGKTLTVEIGYQNNHVAYLGKTGDVKRYAIKMKDGSMICSADGAVLEFADLDSAKAHAEQRQILLDEYMNVLNYSPAAAPLQAVKGW